MATIYLSSTYSDLKACREAVYHALQKMQHHVIAMEDYVAKDQRPLDKCLDDVARCDLYIGLFAWRYGYVPSESNPERRSITDLEYRTAIRTGKHCLIFILAEDAPWSPTAMDVVTGENDRGERIAALRKELAQDKLVSFFKAPEQLASLVAPAVHQWENSQRATDTTEPSVLAQTKQSEKVEREVRLRTLLIDHTGFMSNRLSSFVGRVRELAEISQRIAEMIPTGGYVTITGQAGQGKSCIIAKLVEEYGPERTAHHFIPFNPGPDYQISLLRDLMARLILKYDLFDLYAASENRAALRDYFPKVLKEIVEKGGRELIFIDGLDQLKEDKDGERDLSFLPDNPPSGVVFVLGTRPNDTLRPLELLKPHYAYPLPNLSRQDFTLLLEHRKVKLDHLLADRFYKAMQENALYLDLVARELAQEGTAAPENIIKRVADNPNNIFSLSLARMKRQGVEWRSVLKPVLGVLLVASEPLSRRHIRQILEVDDERLGEGLARLGGLVADDGRQRYSLFHLKLQDYLRQGESEPRKEYIFARDEEESWHKKLVDWCKVGGMAVLWQDVQKRDPTEQGRREYAREHYTTHLYYSLEWESLFAVLDEGVYGRAKVRYDPSARLYVQDLDLGRQAAAWDGWTLEEGLERLPNLCRYMLLRCSLASRADRYPLAAFRLLVLLKRMQEAVRLAELLSDPARKTLALLAIAQQMRNRRDLWPERTQILLRAHEVAYTIEESDQRIRKLKELCGGLAEVEQWERAEMAAREVVEWVEKPEVFGELGIALARARQWDKAESMIRAELESLQRARWLSELGKALARAQEYSRAKAIWAEAEVLIRAIGESDCRAKALSEFGKVLAEAGELVRAKAIWAEAEVAIRRIVGSNSKARVLIEHGKVLAGAGEREQAKVILAWAETETVLRARRWGFQGRELLSDLCRTLIQVEEWDRAEAAINMIGDDEQAEVLSELAMALSQAQQWERAAAVIVKLKDSDKQVEAMSELAGALAQAREMERAEAVWRRVEGMIHTEKQSNRSEEVLLELSTAFIQLQQWERAAVVLHVLKEKQRRTQELRKLATMLIKLQEWEQAGAIISSIEEDESRTDGLRELGMNLIAVQEWERGEAVIRSIEVSGTRARALFELSAALIKIEELDKAEDIIYTIEEDGERMNALRGLISALAKLGKWQRAQDLIYTIKNVMQRMLAFTEMSGLLAQKQEFDIAETIIRTMSENIENMGGAQLNAVLAQQKNAAWYAISVALARAHEWDRVEAVTVNQTDDKERARALLGLSDIALEEREWGRAETFIRAIPYKEEKSRTEGWYAMSVALARARKWDRAEAVITEMGDGKERSRAIQALRAIALEEREWDRAETFIRAIKEEKSRTEGWYAMSVALTRAHKWDRAETIVPLIEENGWRIQALSELSIALANAHEWDRAQVVIGKIEDAWSRVEPLQELSRVLIEAKEWKRARSALVDASSVLSPWDNRAVEMACQLVIALIRSREWEQVEEVIQTIWNSHRNSQMKHEFCLALVEARFWEKAEAVILTIEKTDEEVEALGELGTALIEAKEWERADIVLTMIRAKINSVEGARRKEILYELRKILIQAQQWKRTEAIILTIEEVNERVEALSELVAALAKAHQGEQAQAVIRSLEDHLHRVEVLSALGVALAEVEEWQREEATWAEIETIVDTIEDWQHKEQMLSKLEVALMAARQWERVKKVIYTIKWGAQRAKALIELGVTLWQMQEWDKAKAVWTEAEAIVDTIEVNVEKATTLRKLAGTLAKAGEYEWLLRLVQDSWLRANTEEYAISLLPIANGLIPLKPKIGTSFCEAFIWMDSFLKE